MCRIADFNKPILDPGDHIGFIDDLPSQNMGIVFIRYPRDGANGPGVGILNRISDPKMETAPVTRRCFCKINIDNTFDFRIIYGSVPHCRLPDTYPVTLVQSINVVAEELKL